MKKNEIKNALRVLVAICATATITSVFTSCAEQWHNLDEIEPETKTVEVPVKIESEHTNWINDSLYVGTSAMSSWLLAADVNITYPALLKEVAKQGKPSFTNDELKEVRQEGNISNFSYSAEGSDDQILTGYVKVREDDFVHVSNIDLHVKDVKATEINIGEARATKITVLNELTAEVSIDGKTDTVRHNLKNTYIQCEEVLRTETVEKVIKEVQVDTLIQVDSVTVYIYEQVRDTLVITDKEEVHDTVIVNKYTYLKGERVEMRDRIGYSLANVKVGNEVILTARFDLAQRVVTVPEEKLNTAVLTNYSDNSCSMDDGQSGVLTISANGCTVNRIAWADPVMFDTDSYGTLFDVACTLYCSRVNECGETVNFEVQMVPSYYHVAATPEPQVVTYTVGFSNEAPAANKLQGVFFVDGSDGYHEEFKLPVAVYGLPVGIDTLYVKNMTVEGHKAESTTTEGTLKAKNGFNWCYDQTFTTVETLYRTINEGLVGPYNRLTYKVAHVEKELPNGQKVVWRMVAETVVDDDQYVTDSSKSDHFCEEEGHMAHYESSLHQHVTHYISGTVTIGEETTELVFNLQKVGNKYLLDEGTAVTNIYSTGN